ncbi:MAG: LytTR family transcriptional regulator [Herbinix sp.]|jgi:DNA-binding LytR/AlgR family response regulator|nr:LytTR family transcriptional regulator [Herbinix sp.]
MKLNIAVCEDESIPLKINCTYIEELSKKYRVDANIIGFTSGEAALEYMSKVEIDIVFMDIDLNGMNGIQTASRMLKMNPRIITIFITGHKEFAYDAFTVEAFSFIIKPIDPERLERIFRKAVLQVNDFNNRKQRSPFIITEDNLKKKINQSSILYIERIDTQSVIVTKSSKHFVYETITSLSERLDNNFIRINQGIIVNLSEVSQLNKNQLQMKTGEEFPIGRTYVKEVKRRYLEFPQI